MVAGDEESYVVFKDLFDPVISGTSLRFILCEKMMLGSHAVMALRSSSRNIF